MLFIIASIFLKTQQTAFWKIQIQYIIVQMFKQQ